MSFVSSPHPPPPPPLPRGEDMDDISDHLEMHCARRKSHHERRRGTLQVLGSAIPCVYTKRQKKRSQYPAILTEQAWSRIYYMAKLEKFSERTSLAGPSREIRRGRILPDWVTNQKVVCEQALHLGDIVKRTRASGTQGETRPKRNIRFILPTRGLSYIMKHQTGCTEALVQGA